MSALPARLLPVLRQLTPETFLSGECIAQRLGCSRGTVHNAIQAALATGFKVHAVHGRGYRLAEPVSWLDADRLGRFLTPRGIVLRLQDQLDSTNARLLQWATAGASADAIERAPHRTLLGTEWQVQGRGRRGRNWQAGLGSGLTFSYLWRSGRPPAQLSGLSLAVGVALVKGLRELGLAGAQVKWPNDIQVSGAKLAGVLIELASDRLAGDMLAPCAAVIGVGINVFDGEVLTRQVGQSVTDLHAHLGRIDRNDVLLHLIARLDADLVLFEREGFTAFRDDWHRFHVHQDRPVCLQAGQEASVCGVARGVDSQGAILLETAAGVRSFHSGEVSLRALS